MEVQALLRIYAEEEIQREFKSANRNYKVYAKIYARLSEMNIEHTVKQVREKLKKLKQDYKKTTTDKAAPTDARVNALRETEEANRAILQNANEQCERYMQLLLQAQVQELELRRQELELLQEYVAERRRLQRDFQVGFPTVLGQLVNSPQPKEAGRFTTGLNLNFRISLFF
ncbi:uncharacterized protein V6R79_001130 [Siganus canaliculatus]